jgi:hypothetical protein
VEIVENTSALLQENKKPPWFPKSLETKGVMLFWRPSTAKKETAFRLSLWWTRRDLNVSHQVRDKIHVFGRNGSSLSPSRQSADGFENRLFHLFSRRG